MMKKLLASILLSLTILFSFAPLMQAHAQSTWYNQSFPDWFQKVYDQKNPNEIFGERYTAAQVQWVIWSLFSYLITAGGPQNANLVSCFISSSVDITKCISDIKETISPLTSLDNQIIASENKQSLLGAIFADRPISGISYFRQKFTNFQLVPVAHAQSVGFGFAALSPIQGLWTAFRNVAFGFFVIIAVVFAFMIMFRVKLNPQTVITVQSALPKIIISLIVVTFSYAIAGFMIDIMYLVIGIISAVMAPLVPVVLILHPSAYSTAGLFNLLTVGGPGGIFFLLFRLMLPLIILLLLLLGAGIALAAITGPAGGIIALIALLLIAVLVIVLLWISIKIIFALFKALVNVILLTIFGPLQLLLGTLIPNFGFGQWLRNLASSLSVFVVTGVLWLLSWIFLLQAWAGLSNGVDLNFSPVNGASPWPPFLGIGGSGLAYLIMFSGVSFVIFTLIPKSTEIVQGFISGKPFAYGSAIGEAIAPVAGPARFVGGAAKSVAIRTGAGYGAEELSRVKLTPAQQQGNLARIVSQLQETLRSMQQKGA